MKRLFLTLLVALLGACASGSNVNEQARELFQWRDAARAEALAGMRKWSEYYVEYHDRMGAMPYSPYAAIEMQTIAELIPYARKYEAGEITKDQFYDMRRIVGGRGDAARAQLAAQDQANEAAQTGAMLQAIGQSLKPAPTVNCTTTRLPGSITSNTTCR